MEVDAAGRRRDRWRLIAAAMYSNSQLKMSPGDALAQKLMQACSPPGRTPPKRLRLTLLLRARVMGTKENHVMPKATKRPGQGRDDWI